MSTPTIDAITRQAAARLSRRRSLLALGGAVLAATVSAGPSSAKKNKRKRKGADCKKKEKQRCSNDAAACKATVQPLCIPENPAGCLAVQTCCVECSATGFVTCLLAAQQL